MGISDRGDIVCTLIVGISSGTFGLAWIVGYSSEAIASILRTRNSAIKKSFRAYESLAGLSSRLNSVLVWFVLERHSCVSDLGLYERNCASI